MKFADGSSRGTCMNYEEQTGEEILRNCKFDFESQDGIDLETKKKLSVHLFLTH